MQDTKKDFIPYRQDPVDLAAGKGRMQEESNLDIGLAIANFLTKHRGQQHEMIIMHPNKITILYILCNGFGKDAIGFKVSTPCRFIKGDLAGMIMEQWPKN